MSDTKNYNPYNVDSAEFDVRDTLSDAIRGYYDKAFEHIGKYDTEQEWEVMLNIKPRHKRIRLAIWTEVKRLVRHGKTKMVMSRAFDGVAGANHFHRMCKNPELCAYFFTKPVDHNVEARILLDDSLDNIRSILRLPQMSSTGRVNASVVTAHMKIFELLQNRVLGQSVQRIQQHTVQEHKKSEEPRTIAEIDAELAKLEDESSPEALIEAEVVDQSEDSQTGE